MTQRGINMHFTWKIEYFIDLELQSYILLSLVTPVVLLLLSHRSPTP